MNTVSIFRITLECVSPEIVFLPLQSGVSYFLAVLINNAYMSIISESPVT